MYTHTTTLVAWEPEAGHAPSWASFLSLQNDEMCDFGGCGPTTMRLKLIEAILKQLEMMISLRS